MQFLRNLRRLIKTKFFSSFQRKLESSFKPIRIIVPSAINPCSNTSSGRFCIIIVVTFLSLMVSSCYIDQLPGAVREGKAIAKSQFYGYRSDKYQEIEDSYMAAQNYCCAADKPNNSVRALELYCRAAKAGHKASMIEVGRLYAHAAGAGEGTPIPYDRALAYAYFDLASQEGYEYGAAMKDEMAEKLSAAELERARKLAASFPDIPCEITE